MALKSIAEVIAPIVERANRVRYGLVRCDRRGSEHARYDIVDHGAEHGFRADEVLVSGVLYAPACDIVAALNERERHRQFARQD